MSDIFQNLFAHMAWADDAVLAAVAAQQGAFEDDRIRKLLQHTMVVESFFLCLFEKRPFDQAREGKVADSLDEMKQRFGETHARISEYVARLDEAELSRAVEFPVPAWKHFQPPVRDALLQVASHGEHHRAQIVMRLREMGATPPGTDYILWVRDVRGRG